MSFTRQINLAHLADFGRNLRAAFIWAGIPAAEQAAVCETYFSAKCALCQKTVSGGVLAPVLLDTETPASSSGGLARLRMGYCMDRSCRASFYEFTFTPHPVVDWMQIPLTPAATPPPAKAGDSLLVPMVQTVTNWVRAQITWRAAAALAAVLVLWAVHQWNSGGRIPIIREPKVFTSEMPPGTNSQPELDKD